MIDLKSTKILIVEDSESILIAIRDYLISTFAVSVSTSFDEAIEILKKNLTQDTPIQLLIADINLQNKNDGKDGIELCRQAKLLDNNIKTALITSYEINDYIDIIYQNGINQVITKHNSMSLYDIQVMAYKTITGDIFGIQKYFPDIKIFFPSERRDSSYPQNKEVFSFTIRSFEEAMLWNEQISQNIQEQKNVSLAVVRLVLDELTTNALFKAPRDENGDFKYQYKLRGKNIVVPLNYSSLDEEDHFILQYGYYDDWIVIACIDPHGTLRKKDILYRLRRHIMRDSVTGFPQGLVDSHGRGFFLLREHLTHLIFNLHENKKTEVLAFYRKGKDIPYKNISIYEHE